MLLITEGKLVNFFVQYQEKKCNNNLTKNRI
jgi:hypothetical protein